MTKATNDSYPTKDQLIKLLEIARSKDIQKCTERATYTNYFMYLSLLILGGGLAVFTGLKSSLIRDIALIIIGAFEFPIPILLFMHIQRTYRNQNRYIAQAAKLEDLLLFDSAEIFGGNFYWDDSGLMDQSFKADRMRGSIEEFIENESTSPVIRNLKKLVYLFSGMGVVLIILGILSLFNII